MDKQTSRISNVNPETNLSSRPQWWTDKHSSTWDRVKAALRRDWEQTKADFSSDSGAVRVKAQGKIASEQQAAREKIAEAQRKASERVASVRDWNQVESAIQYGYGARLQYADSPTWDDQLESRLRHEWTQLKNGDTWEDVQPHVRHGWDAAARNSIV